MASITSPAAKLLTVTVLISVLCTASYGYGGTGRVGGRTQIEDVKTNTKVQELGRFSVTEYNRSLRRGISQSNGGGELQFAEVVEAQSQVVSGIKYYLKVSAVRNGANMLFDSEVVVKPWLRSKQLLNFAPHNSD